MYVPFRQWDLIVLDRQAFELSVVKPDIDSLTQAVFDAKKGDVAARDTIVASLCWSAFCCPAALTITYDLISSAWLRNARIVADQKTSIPISATSAPLDNSFWRAFWAVVDEQDFDAASITEAVASLGGAVDGTMLALSETAARDHPGAAAALEQPIPDRIDIRELERAPDGSLGNALYRMVTENNYDLEVLDREDIQLTQLPKALQYLNTRILQMHDVWHLVAGYSTSGSHEIAISAFQLAQFGHNYSAMFLAVVMMKSHHFQPRSFSILMQLIMEAWRHGRETPPMMDIVWEQEWNFTIEEIRSRHGIECYNSLLSESLLETFATGSLWERLRLGIQLARMLRQLRAGETLTIG